MDTGDKLFEEINLCCTLCLLSALCAIIKTNTEFHRGLRRFALRLTQSYTEQNI